MLSSRRPVRMLLAEVREGVSSAVILAGVCAGLSLPMLHYQTHHLLDPLFTKPLTADQALSFTLFHVLLIFAASLLCALVGFLYAPRLGLIGMKLLKSDRKFLPLYFVIGLLLTPAAYWLVDMHLQTKIPLYFPEQAGWALAQTLGRVLAPEVIARFGLVTVGVYLWRWLRFTGHPWPASLLVAGFAGLEAWIGLERLGLKPAFDFFTLRVLGLAVAFNWVVGEVYLRRGLLPVLALRLGIELKYPLYALFFF